MHVRSAESGDLAQIVDVFWQCWRRTYAEQLSSALQQAMDPARAAELWTTALSDPVSTVLVAGSGREGVLGVTRFRLIADGAGYIASLYVHPQAHGRGVGRELLTTAEQELARVGARNAQLWVFAANTGAQEFYRRSGWQPTGQTRTEDAFGEPEIGMTKALRYSTKGVDAE